MTRAIITVVGKDTVGIIAKVCNYLADNKINILDISQTIVQDFFNMMMIVDMSKCDKPFDSISSELTEIGTNTGVQVKCQLEDIFNKINKVVVKEGITHIGELCLAYMGFDLGMDGAIDVEVSLPYNLKTIAAEAFTYSYGLKSLELPNYVESIGNRAFHGCHNLARIAIDQSGVSVKVYDVKGNCIIANNVVVYGCYTATIPEGVKSIGSHAFAGQKRLKSITIPSSVESIKYLEEEFITLVAILTQQRREVLHRRSFNLTESVEGIHITDSVENIVALRHFYEAKVACTFRDRGFLCHIGVMFSQISCKGSYYFLISKLFITKVLK